MKHFGLSSAAVLLATSAIFPLSLAQAQEGWSVGGFAVIAPKYEGSKSYRAFGFPLVIPSFGERPSAGETSEFRPRVKFKGLDDVRVALISTDKFEIGPVAGYRMGRKQSAGVLLDGLGDVKGGLVLGGYVGMSAGPAFFDLSYSDQLTGGVRGGQLKLGASANTPLNETLSLNAGIGATYATETYMDSYFGVSAAQAGTSTAGLAAFDPKAGFKDVNFSLGTDVKLSSNWTAKLGGKYSRLLNDAALSPVIETKNQFSGTFGLIYKFGN